MNRSYALDLVNYYYITDEECEIPLIEQVKTAVDSGVKMVQYRTKSGTDRERYEKAKELKDICKNEAIFVVNDRVDIALAAEAEGVHLGQNDLPPSRVRQFAKDILIGISTNNVEQAKQAEGPADYIAVGPVHETETKQDKKKVLGVSRAKQIADSVDIFTVAIGGVEEEDIDRLADEFDMICAISGVTREPGQEQEGDLSEKIDHFESKILEVKKRR